MALWTSLPRGLSQDGLLVREAAGGARSSAERLPGLSLHTPLGAFCSWANRALSATHLEVACPSPLLGPRTIVVVINLSKEPTPPRGDLDSQRG